MEPFTEYSVTVPALGTVTILDPQGEPGYRVRLPSGEVTAFPAASSNPCEANAVADIEAALATPPPAPVPSELTRFRFIVALRRELGLDEGAVYALLSALPAGDLQDTARDGFENASVFKRTNPLLSALAQAGNYTSAQIDDLFRAGAAYTDLD